MLHEPSRAMVEGRFVSGFGEGRGSASTPDSGVDRVELGTPLHRQGKRRPQLVPSRRGRRPRHDPVGNNPKPGIVLGLAVAAAHLLTGLSVVRPKRPS